MQDIEPYYNWRHLYCAEEDDRSPFYGRTYSEFEYENTVYNYYIHPQWDSIGSRTLYTKVLFADYDLNFAIIELIGEWNDPIENDVMQLRKALIDEMIDRGIQKFILIGENVFNYHSGDTDYYEDWLDNILPYGGWVCCVNFSEVCTYEMQHAGLKNWLQFQTIPNWRSFQPLDFFHGIDNHSYRFPLLDDSDF